MRFLLIALLLPLNALQAAGAPPIPGSVSAADVRFTLTGCGNFFASTMAGFDSVTLNQ